MDLSSLKTYLAKRPQPLRQHEKMLQSLEKEKYTVVLPNMYLLSVEKDVYTGMSTYVHSTLARTQTTVNNLPVSSTDTDCRGSPLNRSP